MKQERGFTLVEVIIAILVLTVGLLGLVTTAGLVTRMIGRGQRSGAAAQYSSRRLEMLRVSGCTSQASGSEVLLRGSQPLDSLTWRFVNLGNSHWRVVMRSKYQTALGKWRTDSLGTEISCIL
jgi:prepilin-type N-terminal cleavage/methylation domain-containing protein